MPEAFLGIGGNLGDREAMLRAAVAGLAATAGVEITAASPIYETPPWGPVPQGPYLNACLAIQTRLVPRALLAACHAIEGLHGRERSVRWGPRTLDIDILLYGLHPMNEPGLTVPHPRMTGRAFVLVPLAAIAPYLSIAGRPIGAWIEQTGHEGIAERTELPPLLPA